MSPKLAFRPNRESLRTQGFEVEYFPAYVNSRKRLHSLDIVLLSCILRGHGRHYIGSEEFEEQGHSVAVTHYGQRHDIVTDAAGMDIVNLYVDLAHHPLPPLPPELEPAISLFLPLHPRFVHRMNRIVRIQFDDLGPAAELLFAIEREQRARAPGHEAAARHYFALFLMLCCRRVLIRGAVLDRPARGDPFARLEKLRAYLDSHYAEPHTLDDLSRRAKLSRSYLCRAFKRYTGKALFDYLVERRIEAAMLGLRDGRAKVLEVALDSGFNDLSYFNRTFRKLVGLTPTAYRANFTTPAAR